MIIYRVQDGDGRGAWKPGFSHRWVEDRPESEYQFLKPAQEQFPRLGDLAFESSMKGRYLGCGCKSLVQLRRWFMPREYSTLIRYGYQAVQMEVDRILDSSDIQCVFERAMPLNREVVAVELYPPF